MPRSVNRPAAYRSALGHRAILLKPSNQWMGGPFQLDATVLTASATDTDLTTHDAWYGDMQARNAYTLSDGATTKVKATLHLEWFEILFPLGAFAGLDIDTKDNIYAAATKLYLEANVGGTLRQFNVVGHCRELFGIEQKTQAAAADGEWGRLIGTKHLLPESLNINLEVDSFRLKSVAATVLGADTPVIVHIGGCVWPAEVGVPGVLPGGSCAVDSDVADTETFEPINPQLAIPRLASLQAQSVLRAFGP